MAGVAVDIDKKIERQVLLILARQGLIQDRPDMTREEAEAMMISELEKGEKSGICPLSHEEFWKQFGL